MTPAEAPAPASPGALALTADELARAGALRRISRLATGLLLLMGGLYCLAIALQGRYPGLAYLRAFSEAAMVGALADWFAVTALFRRPLGLPIPHTAIVREKKARIGESLGRFVEHNFLSTSAIEPKLAQLDLAARAEAWLAQPEHRASLATQLAGALPELLESIDDAEASALVERTVHTQAARLALGPLASRVLAALAERGQHLRLFDAAVAFAERTLLRHQADIRDQVGRGTGRWVPSFVDARIAEGLITALRETFAELKAQPDHYIRQQYLKLVADLTDDLATSPEYTQRLEALKAELLASGEARAQLADLWPTLKGRLLADLESPESRVRARIEQALAQVGARLLAEPDTRARLNGWVRRTVLGLIEDNRSALGALISDTVRRWDANTVTRKLELQLGKDLQYIRINGTLVGGLAGLLLHVLTQLLK